MNFMPARSRAAGRSCRSATCGCPASGRAGRHATGKVIAGIRPENFEDAELVGDMKNERGAVFKAEIDLVESLGSDLFAYFHVEHEGIQSEQLAELVADVERPVPRRQP